MAKEDKSIIADDTTDVFDDTATFEQDKILGIKSGNISGKPIDNKAIDDYLAKIERPTGGSVYDKMAARYRSQGEGAVLRTQKNLSNLFGPTINLIQEREAAAQARFTLLKDKMPEFDDSTIFGTQSGNEMPVIDEVKNISASVKEDLRMLSRLNPADERYDEIKKRVQKNQDSIVTFDKINKQLLKIRNAGTDESQWSKGMDPTTASMWRDIYTSDGKNIKIVDGNLIWTDPNDKSNVVNLNEIGDGPTMIDSKATNMDRVIQGEVQKFIEMNGKVDDPMYATMIKAKLFELNKIGPQGIKSLIFDGIGTDDDDLFTGMNTNSFIEGVIRTHYGEGLSESEIEEHIDMMRSGDVTQMYTDESGKKTTLQSQFMKWYKGEIDKKITEGRKSDVLAAAAGTTVTKPRDTTDDAITPPSSWVDFKQSFAAHDFGTDEKFMLPTSNFEGEVIDPYISINKDGTYNLQIAEDDNRNQNNLNIKDLSTKLQSELYPNTTVEAIENMFKAQSESQEDYTEESYESKEQSFANKIAKLEAPYIERMSQGADVNYIVKNIWEPNTPKGYNMGQNGKALFDYLANQGFGSKQKSLYDLGRTNWGGKAFIEFPKAGTKGMTMLYSGEKIWIYERNMAGNSKQVGTWTGDSTGGKSYDKEDIKEILTKLGIAH